MKYLPIAGTNAWRDKWTRADSPFGLMMKAEGFEPLLAGGRQFRWSTGLDGLFGDDREWEAASDAAYFFLRDSAYEDRNLIAHSHGGQVALILAASGFHIRTLTTVGTPPRENIPVAAAEENIGFHQHIYDVHRDLWGWLGQVGAKQLHFERSFANAHVVNFPVAGISHSTLLRDPKRFHYWKDNGWLENIRSVAAPAVAGV